MRVSRVIVTKTMFDRSAIKQLIERGKTYLPLRMRIKNNDGLQRMVAYPYKPFLTGHGEINSIVLVLKIRTH